MMLEEQVPVGLLPPPTVTVVVVVGPLPFGNPEVQVGRSVMVVREHVLLLAPARPGPPPPFWRPP